MAYAAAVLEADGVEVAAIDACAERLSSAAFFERFSSHAPDLVVLEVSTPTIHEDLRTVAALREQFGFSGRILLAGLHKPLYQPEFLEQHPLVDGTLIGEYEYALRDLVRVDAELIEPIPGLIWRRSGELLNGSRKESVSDLDAMPWPARHLFPMASYHDLPGGIPGPSVQMWGSRGCSFTCNFCAWPQILYADNRYRVRSPAAIADEMEAMIAKGYQSIYFDDDTFNLGRRRTADLARVFNERGIDVPWAFMGRADTCAPEQFESLARSGLAAVKFGVESADSGTLKAIGKNLKVQQVRDAVSAVKAQGVKVHLTFMFGLEGETADSMQRTLDLAYELDPDSAQFTVAVPFPGSRLHQELQAEGRLDGLEYEDLDGYRTGVVSTDALAAEQIVAFVQAVHRRWERRSRPTEQAPRIPIVELGGRDLTVGLLARVGQEAWLSEALGRLRAELGEQACEVVVLAEEGCHAVLETIQEQLPGARALVLGAGLPLAESMTFLLEQSSGSQLLLLQAGVLPRKGCLEAVTKGFQAHPEAGALAFQLHGDEGGVFSSALSMSRWGRVLEHHSLESQPVLVAAVSSVAAAYRRSMLEDTGGFDSGLVGELGDADLCTRGLLLGYRSLRVEGAGFDVTPHLKLLLLERPAGGAEDLSAWAEGRVRLLLRSMPREALQDVRPQLLAELIADLYRARRDGGRPTAMLRGFLQGLAGSKQAIAERRDFLGRRRVGAEFIRDSFRVFEQDMRHCRWQRVLTALNP